MLGHRRHFFSKRATVRLRSTLCLVVIALIGCGGDHQSAHRSGHARAGARGTDKPRACPGAKRCPYRGVRVIGRRGEGVLRIPEAVALGPHGDVYVADQRSFVIQRFSAHGTFESEWGMRGAGPGQFDAIGGLAVDRRGNVYAVDSAHDRVQKFTARGRFITAWGRRGRRLGRFQFGGGGRPDQPPGGGIAVGGDHVFVADTQNDRIQRFNLDGSHPVAWGGPGSRPGRLSGPRGIAVTGHSVYIADNGNRRIGQWDLRGRPLASVGTFGRGRGQFANPYGVTVDARGDVFVADNNNNRIVALSSRLAWVRTWSTTPGGPSPFGYARALAATSSGRIYVAVSGKDRIEVFDRTGNRVGGWGVIARRRQISAPMGLAVSRSGAIIVGDVFGGRSRLILFTPQLRYATTWVNGGGIVGHHYFAPTAADVAGDGTVWVADRDNQLIRHLSPDGVLLNTIGGPGRARGRFDHPSGMALGPHGEVIVADTGNDRVQLFSPDGRVLAVWSKVGGSAFRGPTAVAVNAGGDIYVADTGNSRVVAFGPRGTPIAVWTGTGAARLREPGGIDVDPRGAVYVADTGNDRIEKFTARGRLLAAWGRPGTGPGHFVNPSGLAVDCRGGLVVADTDNNRLQRFSHVAAATGCDPSGLRDGPLG